jgi:hypothetical protein
VASGPGPTGQYCRPLAAPLPTWAMATGTLSAVGHAVGHGVRCIFLQTLGRPIIFENRDKLNIKKIRSIYYKRALASRLDNMFWAQMGGTHSCRQTSDAPHLPHLSVFPSSLSLSVPVDSAAAVVPGALRWAGGGRGPAGGGAGRSTAAAASGGRRAASRAAAAARWGLFPLHSSPPSLPLAAF